MGGWQCGGLLGAGVDARGGQRHRRPRVPLHSMHASCETHAPASLGGALTHAQEQHVVRNFEGVARAAVRARGAALGARPLAALGAALALALVLVLQRLADGAGVDAAGDGARVRVDGNSLRLEKLALLGGG